MPSGPVSGEAMTARVPSPCCRRRRDDPLEDLAVDGRVAHDAMVRPAAAGLELRLHERDDVTGWRRPSVAAIGPRTSPSEMNETSTVAMAIGSGSVVAVSVAGVRALHRDDPRVAPQRLRELAAADVEGVDASRAALQQDVGEAARRGADVEGDQARRIDLEGVERGGQLVAAAADVRVRLGDRDRRVRGDQVARLAVVPRRVALPHPDRAGQHQRLGTAARLGQAALDQQLVEADARGLRGSRGTGRRRGLTRLSWHSAASPGITSTCGHDSTPPRPPTGSARAWRAS